MSDGFRRELEENTAPAAPSMVEVRLFYRDGSSVMAEVSAGPIASVVLFEGLYFFSSNGQYREATVAHAVKKHPAP